MVYTRLMVDNVQLHKRKKQISSQSSLMSDHIHTNNWLYVCYQTLVSQCEWFERAKNKMIVQAYKIYHT